MRYFSILAALTLAACSSGESKDGDAQTAKTDDTVPAAAAATVSLTSSDIDGFEKGIAQEIHLVKEGQYRANKASTPVERGNAIQSTFEENTIAKAVDASGLSLDRYRLVRQTLSKLLTTLDFQGKIEGPQSVDTTFADSAMKARLASDPYAALDPASAALVKQRLGTIVPLWVDYVKLTVTGG
jgi:hypothetical protein